MLPSIFVNSLTIVFKADGPSFATHCFAFCLDCSALPSVRSSDSSCLSDCVKENVSSSGTSEEEVVTSIGVVWITSRIFRPIFSVTLTSSLERKLAAVLTERVSDRYLLFEIKLQQIVACNPECWRNCVCLEKTCDGLVVCQNICWHCCFPQKVCKLEKCHVECQNFF